MAFNAARLFCPVNVQWLRATDASVNSLRAFLSWIVMLSSTTSKPSYLSI